MTTEQTVVMYAPNGTRATVGVSMKEILLAMGWKVASAKIGTSAKTPPKKAV